MNIKTKAIQEFWNTNPVNSQFVEYKMNSEDFYKEYDDFRYKKEGHILDELDLIDWKNKKVLEIGLGHGSESAYISSHGGLFWGLDLTKESISRVKERFKLFKLKFEEIIEGDASMMPFEDNFFDIVITHGVIHHSPEMDKIISEIYRVLKTGGKGIVMVYHRNSINYYLSIAFIRRVGLIILRIFPFMVKLISKITGESNERIRMHIQNMKQEGISYLRMKNFIHRSTDGPDNVFSSIWSKKDLKIKFNKFRNISFKIHFLNERHLLGLQYILPKKIKNILSHKFGWHIWVFVEK